jgi:hypothetical protein
LPQHAGNFVNYGGILRRVFWNLSLVAQLQGVAVRQHHSPLLSYSIHALLDLDKDPGISRQRTE